MAYVTRNLGCGVTCTVSYDHPYTLARRFSTLDQVPQHCPSAGQLMNESDEAAPRPRGTEGSNPVPSSKESANFRSLSRREEHAKPRQGECRGLSVWWLVSG